jgi:hypothetical protein
MCSPRVPAFAGMTAIRITRATFAFYEYMTSGLSVR